MSRDGKVKGKLPWRIGTKVSQLPQPSMCTIYDGIGNFVAVAETRALAEQIVDTINAWKPGTKPWLPTDQPTDDDIVRKSERRFSSGE